MLFTVGYQGRSVPELIELLGAHHVEVLVDVRLNPISRKAGFSKRSLAQALGDAGIAYRHERTLGNPVDNRAGFRGGDRTARQRYQELLTGPGADALAQIVSLAATRPVALLCFEHDPAECHRTMVADHLTLLDPTITVLPL